MKVQYRKGSVAKIDLTFRLSPDVVRDRRWGFGDTAPCVASGQRGLVDGIPCSFGCSGGLVKGLLGLTMDGLWGILSGLTKSTDHPSMLSSSKT